MATPAMPQPPAARGGRYRGPRRRGRGGGSQQIPGTNSASLPQLQDPSINLRPAPAAPIAQQQQPVAQSGASIPSEHGPRNNERGGRRNRGGRGNRGGGRTGNQAVLGGGGRTFGSQLTAAAPESDTGSVVGTPRVGLQADAPEFRPGQPVAPRQRRAPARPRRMSKSQAPDLASRIHEDISRGLYECAICSDEISRKGRVWSCETCWTVFHLHCVKKWAKNDHFRPEAQNGEMPPPRQWRCPGCNLPKDELPSNYDCWCGKEVEPRNIPGIPPHSCGQSCMKDRLTPKKCPHPCELLCHAGPCPPCIRTVESSCFCGKKSASRRCLDTDYNGWSCQEICGDPMPNCDHICQKLCHEGLCGGCEIEVESKCYCGKIEKTLKCCDRDEEKESVGKDGVWIGSFECELPCERQFDCNFHSCKEICHPQDSSPAHCPLSPDLITHCPCGKTPLSSLLDKPRSSCQDPVPQCKAKCMKELPCGHFCQDRCHKGACAPWGCLEKMLISCRCGRIPSTSICHQGKIEPPQCARICRATLNCGRHECDERCCEGDKKAVERQAKRRKLRPLGAPRHADEGFEAEHICTRVCGRPLKCGNHTCQELCHKGPCGSCREAIFNEISCHCGRTVLHPPLPCGTSPPLCRQQCNRPTACGHPQVPHNCHGDEEACPKCPYLLEKSCMCGKKLLKNQACWFRDTRCGEICGKKLKCGIHLCRNLCHRPGECEDSDKPCTQLCSRPKKTCPHLCTQICHKFGCNDEKACDGILIITCSCQNRKTSMKCLATKTNPGNTKETLPCNEECARLLRNQRLAKALDIDPATHVDDHIPYSQDTLQMFKDSVKWCQIQEREIRVFAADDREKRLRFAPMKPHQRKFLHCLAADFGLDSESMDPEPHRHIVLFKTPKFVSAPMKTLAQCARIKSVAEPPAVTAMSSVPKKLVGNADPFNALLLNNPRFALTTEELQADFARDFATVSASLKFDIFFLPSEQILLKPTIIIPPGTESGIMVERSLRNIKPAISRTISSKKLATSVSLCRVDSSLNVLRREDEEGKSSGGWSQVAAKGAAPVMQKGGPGVVGGKSAFTVLGNLKRKKEEARREEERLERERMSVPESWEDVVEDGTSGGGDGSSGLASPQAPASGPASPELEAAGGSGQASGTDST